MLKCLFVHVQKQFICDNDHCYYLTKLSRYYSDFYTFNGKEVIEFQLETGEKLHLDAHIEKGKAKVSFTRKGEKNGEVISNIEDADTYFTADETGRYVVKINFKHAKGTVEIKCDDQVKDKTIYR